jgi:hypothetical protein
MSRRVVCGGARRGRAMADCSRGGDASFAKAETSASTGHLAYLGAQGRTGSVNHARGSRGRRGAGRGLTRRCEKWVRSVRPADMRAPICPRAPRRASAPPAGVARRRRRGSLALPCSAERWSRAPAALPRAAPQGREGGVAGGASSASCVVECCPTRPAPRSAHRAQPTALSPPRSAPAPGGTPATFPSGVSATPPPARAIRPPAPSLRAGGWWGGATNGSNLLVARVRGEGGLKGRLMDEQARALAQRDERLARPRIARAHHAPSARSGLRRGAEQHARGVAARMPHLHRADRHAEPRGLLRARPALRPPRAPRRAATSCVGCTVWDAGFGFGFKVWERGGAPPCH